MTYEELAKQYDLKPGRSAYLRANHASGLGGRMIYVPISEKCRNQTIPVERSQDLNTRKQ